MNITDGLSHKIPLHFILICDCSGLMVDSGKIQALNNSIRELIPDLLNLSHENPLVDILVRSIKFSSGAQWHISHPTSINDFKWIDLIADGASDMGTALKMVAKELKCLPMSEKALSPVLVLISGSQPTDDYVSGIKELKSTPWEEKAVRIAFAIGTASGRDALREFIGDSELKPLEASKLESIVKNIKLLLIKTGL